MGPFWCSCQHHYIRLNPYPVCIMMSSTFPIFYSQFMYIYTFSSLSASIEAGAFTIEIDGKKNRSWCPRRAAPRHYYASTRRLSSHSSETRWYSRRCCFICSFLASGLRMFPGILWKLQWCWYLRKREQPQAGPGTAGTDGRVLFIKWKTLLAIFLQLD